MPDASVDSVVTDPPYEPGFMNRTWDKSGIVWCLTVPTGAFVVRRKGKVFVTGNSGFPKNHDISKAIDKSAGVKGKKIGEKRFGKTSTGQSSGWNQNNKARLGCQDVLAPATDGAKQWAGWGTALKPAFEPICLARKPLSEKTIAANVLQHGTGAINIDGCRELDGTETGGVKTEFKTSKEYTAKVTRNAYGKGLGGTPHENVNGRWPANFIHDGLKEPWAKYFYCAKASKQDRNEGCEAMEEKQYSHDGREVAIDNAYQRNASKSGNHHPTVKPTELMRYLIKLITPPQGVVLDPFMGSGSTGKAATLDGFSFIGIELDEEYVAIAKARIDLALDQVAKETGVLW